MLLAGVVILGLALRVWLNARSQWMIEGDEALFGIGAVRLLHGDFPTFLYGVPYMGMLQSYLAAPVVALLGPSAPALRCVTLLSGVAFIVTTWFLAMAWYGRGVAVVAALLAAVPSVYFDAVSLKVWGSYVDIMVLGDLLLLGAWYCRVYQGVLQRWHWLVLGFISGLALWANLLVADYLLTALLLLPWRRIRRWLPSALAFGLPGFALGGAPLWWYNLHHAGATFRWLFAGTGAGSADDLAVLHVLFRTLLPRVVGLTSPWGSLPGGLTVALGCAVAGALALAAADAPRQWRARGASAVSAVPESRPLLVFLAVTLAVYVLSGFGRPSLSPFDASGRYLLPLWTALPVLLAALCVRLATVWRPLGAAALALLLVGNMVGHLTSDPVQVFQSPYWNRLPMDSRPLLHWLQDNDVYDVWLNHWAGDPLMYLSGDSVRSADYYDIVVGHAINRFPTDFRSVELSQRAAFVLVVGSLPSPGLGSALRKLGVTFRQATVGPYLVYLPLSRRVDPSEVVNALRYPY
jgi:hypothetical protein